MRLLTEVFNVSTKLYNVHFNDFIRYVNADVAACMLRLWRSWLLHNDIQWISSQPGRSVLSYLCSGADITEAVRTILFVVCTCCLKVNFTDRLQ